MENSVVCPNCKRVVGRYIQKDGGIWLRLPGLLKVRVLRAECDHCGSEFNFDVSSKRLEDLIERVKRL